MSSETLYIESFSETGLGTKKWFLLSKRTQYVIHLHVYEHIYVHLCISIFANISQAI